MVVTCIELYKKFPKHLVKDIIFTGEDLNNVIKKIEVREQIIKIIQNNQKLSDDERKSLISLHRDYRKSNYYEEEDLIELSSIIGVELIEKEEIKKYEIDNYNREFEKAIIFMKWINEKSRQNKTNHNEFCFIMIRILTDYPYCKTEEKEKMWNEFDNFKANQIPFDRYLLRVRGEYQDLLDTGHFSDIDIKRDIYNSILNFLNRL